MKFILTGITIVFFILLRAGPGGYSDFSAWIYVYSEKNHLIVNGTNDLTAKMLCSVDNNFNLTRYNSIKIIGNVAFCCSQFISI